MQTTSTAQGEKITAPVSTKEKQVPASVSTAPSTPASEQTGKAKTAGMDEDEDDELKRLRKDNASLQSQLSTAQEGLETVTNDVEEMKKEIVEKEEAQKETIVQEIIAIKEELGTMPPAEQEEEVKVEEEALGSMPLKALASLKRELEITTASVKQALAGTGSSTRVIRTPSVASADASNEVSNVRQSMQEMSF